MRYSTMKKTLLSLCLTCLLTTPAIAQIVQPEWQSQYAIGKNILIYGLMRMLMLRVKGIMSNHLII